MMNLKELDAALQATFDDHRLSRTERDALKLVLEELNQDEDKLRYVRNRAFDIAREMIRTKDGRDTLEWLEGVVKVVDQQRELARPDRNMAFFNPGQECLDCVTQALRNSRYQIDICVYTITDNRIKREILDAWGRKLKIRIITDDEKIHDPGSDIHALSDAGIEVAIDTSDERMHHKFAVFDHRRLVSGSFNWTRSATRANYENLIITEDPALVQAFQTEFERLWDELPRF